MSNTVLYADADATRRTAVADALDETPGLSAVGVESIRAARERLAGQQMDAIVAGPTLTDGAGHDLTTMARSIVPRLPLFLYADASTLAAAPESTLTGRYDADRLSPSALASRLDVTISERPAALAGQSGPDERPATTRAERERSRLAAVDEYDVTAASELPFNRLSELAADALDASVAYVGFVTDTDHLFLGATGLDWDRIDRANSICTHGLCEASHLAVEDLLADPRFATIGGLEKTGLRSYLGVPLRTPRDETLGMLCVMDTEPREYDDSDVEQLRGFAQTVMDMLSVQRPDPLDPAFDS